MFWEATQACALACRHCRATARPLAHPLQLDSEQSLAFLEQVREADPAHFVITGGDPMARPDIHDLIERADRMGIPVSLSPSATPRLLREDFARLRELGIRRMSLSLDGPTEETHNAFRGVAKSWDWTLEAAARCHEAGIPLQINTTVTGDTLGWFDALTPVIESLRPSLWSVFVLVPVGRGGALAVPEPYAMEVFLNRLYDYSLGAPFPVKTTEGMQYRRVVAQRRRAEGVTRAPSGPLNGHRPPAGINDGKGVVFISHIGEIFPSGFLPVAAGNVKSHRLLDIYRDHPLFRRLRDPGELRGKCAYCEYNRLCGGSRARAYAMTRDYMAEDPVCAYQPAMAV